MNHIHTLSLRRNKLKNEELSDLADALRDSNIESLDISSNIDLKKEGIEELLQIRVRKNYSFPYFFWKILKILEISQKALTEFLNLGKLLES